MKKTLENRQSFTRRLMQLLVLMAMLLAPKGAWAEDYVLTVAGHQYTATDLQSSVTVSGENISGTVTITPANDNDPVKLTLNAASITGNVVSSINLKVDFVGSNTITIGGGDYAFVGDNNNTISFVNSGKNGKPLSVSGSFNSKITDNWSSVATNIETGGTPSSTSVWWLNTNTGTSNLMELMWYGVSYGLTVGGVEVKESNASNITGANIKAGIVSYDDATKTLTLSGANLSGEENGLTSIICSMDSIAIELVGTNTLNGYISYDGGQETTGKISFKGSGSLEITCNDGVIYGFSKVYYANGLYLKSAQPCLYWDNESNTYRDRSKEVISNMIISTDQSYPIWVAQVVEYETTYKQITQSNRQNVFNDATSTVSLNEAGDTLTLNGATIDGSIIRGDNNGLTVKFIGSNKIFATNCTPFIGNQGATFSLVTEDSSSNKLAVDGVYSSDDLVSGWSVPNIWVVNTYNKSEANTQTAAASDLWAALTSAYLEIYYNKPYNGVWVNNSQLCNALLEHFDGIKYQPADSTFILSEIEPEVNDTIKTSLPNLKVKVNGVTSLASIRYIGNASPAGTLTIAKDLNSTADKNQLTLSDENDAIYGFSEVTISAPMALKTPASVPSSWSGISEVVILDETISYNLEVADVDVTNANATTGITGENIQGIVTYDAEENVLTLNGATINGRIFSGLEDGLTVHLLGNNVINGGYVDANNNGVYAFVREAAGNDLPLTFTTDAKNPGQLLMKNTYRNENNYVQYYSGFIANYENGLAACYSSDEKRLITVKPVITPDEGLYWTDQEYTISGNGEGTIKYADGMNHFSQTTYEAPFTLSTTGKYLLSATQTKTYDESTFEVSTNGVYIVHNKPDFSIEEGSYVGAQNVTLTNLPAGLATTTESYPQVWYYLNDIKNDSVQYTSAEQTIAVSESTKVCVYILDQDSGKVMKSKAVEAEYTILKSLGLRFYASENSYISTGSYDGPVEFGEEYTSPTLKGDTGNGYTTDLSGFDITYSSSDPTTATIDETGKITIVGGGYTTIKAVSQETETFAADSTWYELRVRPADPNVSISEGAYFTGQKLTLTRIGLSGNMYYSYGSKEASERTAYTGEISLPAGVYDFYPYTRCGTDEKNFWSYGNAHRMLYVYNQPTISKDAGTYEGDIEVEITNLPGGDSYVPTVYYYFDDDEGNAKVYNAGDKIAVRESTKLNVYLIVEGDSGKTHKTEVIERQYEITDITLNVANVDFHEHWTTYYNDNGDVVLPEGQNVGAYVATGADESSVTVTQIVSIPRSTPVLLNNATTSTTTKVFGTDVKGNLLVHATSKKVVDPTEGDFYGLYNGVFMRVTDEFPAGKNYLLIPNAANVNTNAPKLNIVFENEGNTTGINASLVNSEEVKGDLYDLQGRKVTNPKKKGLYIQNGRKVVVNNK